MYSIGKLAKSFKLSRSTLLYYDSIGLLTPQERSISKYRIYSEGDKKKLEKIISFRQMGIPLKEIKKILSLKENNISEILESQLTRIGENIRLLRQQQFAIIKILKNKLIIKKCGIINKHEWISILKSSGLDAKGMKNWHLEFEKRSPQAHYDFLVSLGIDKNEIKAIKKGILI